MTTSTSQLPYTGTEHVMVAPSGEMSNVNYDHCVLGLRASRRMMPYLPPAHCQLSMAQAIWYMPQGPDVWDQLLCEFPGHYARDDKKCGAQPGGTDEQGNDRFDGPAWEWVRSGSRHSARADLLVATGRA